LASKDAAEKEPSPEYIRRCPSPIEEELRPEEIPLPPSPPFKPVLLQLASDLVTSHYQNTTREPQAEPDSEESDDETTSVDVEDTTLLEYEAEAETSAWDADKTLVGNAILVSAADCRAEGCCGGIQQHAHSQAGRCPESAGWADGSGEHVAVS
jgi:hypothetical protein